MKKILLLAIFCLLLSNAWSQSEEKNVIKVNPLGAAIGLGSIFYEHKIDDKHSWQMGVGYWGLNIDNVKLSGIAITPEYRIYSKKNALSGVYIGPYLRYQNLSMKDSDNNKGSYVSYGGGLVFGRQWVYRSGFVLDLFAGPSYNSGRVKSSSGSGDLSDPPFGIDKFGLRIGIALGIGL